MKREFDYEGRKDRLIQKIAAVIIAIVFMLVYVYYLSGQKY